jgi:hypothetical protein
MSWPRTILTTFGAAGLVILVGILLTLVPLWTGPAMPPGATRLHIDTAAPGPTFGCPAALLIPVRIESTADDLVLVSVATGQPVRVVWPGGFAAWRVNGRAEVGGPYGGVVGVEGDVLDSLGGGETGDGAFGICPHGIAGSSIAAPWFVVGLSVALGMVVVGVPLTAWRRRGG